MSTPLSKERTAARVTSDINGFPQWELGPSVPHSFTNQRDARAVLLYGSTALRAVEKPTDFAGERCRRAG